MLLKDVRWKKFKIVEILGNSNNSKAYHSENLKFSIQNEKGIPYITRTNLNNGFFSIVKYDDYKINPANTITLGAENAKYFYQPYPYITGNKMYYYNSKKINKYSGLFITECLNDSIKNCGFGYGMGLTGTRSDTRNFMLPINDNDEPDFEFMEQYIKNILFKEINDIKEYCKSVILNINNKSIPKLSEKNWKAFNINYIFPYIQRGKRLKKGDHKIGNIPYVSSTMMNNGVDNFIGNKEGKRFDNCITIANSGSVGASFYHQYEFIGSDHITAFKNEKFNKYIYLFLATIVSRISDKYSFNREINDFRISNEKILLPVNEDGNPDYEYMEQYIKNIMYKQYKRYLDFLED